MAFKIAGSMAFKEALPKAGPVLLEPIMKVEVVTPEEFMGDVIGDMNSRRGQIEGQEHARQRAGDHRHGAAGGMFGYATDLRSLSQGRATYTMQFSHYEPGAEGRRPKKSCSQVRREPRGELGRAIEDDGTETTRWRKRSSSATSRT